MARKLKPEDKHVTRKELLAELLVLARASDASIAQLREEFIAKRQALPDVSVCHCAACTAKRAGGVAHCSPDDYESVPAPDEGPE